VTWKPGRLNVLIGPNGGGKSNLLTALYLLRAAQDPGVLKKMILRMGGMVPLVWDGQAREIRFEVNATGVPNFYLELARVGNTGGVDATWPVDSTSLAFLEYADKWSIHQDVRTDSTSEVRGTSVSRVETRVESDGQNLIAVLHTLYLKNRDFEEFLDKAMSAAFPSDYEKLIFPPEASGRIELRVRRKHRKRADSSADLSDGTLRFLLLMAILGSPDPAPLIAIDEPETGLHPRMMSLVAEVAANAALKSQIILATHSPELLDALGEELPTTTVVTSNGSETELKTIEGDDLKRWIDNYSFGKFALADEAEAVL
jgi:predicted ATPase